MRKLIIFVLVISMIGIQTTFAEDIPIESIKISVSDTKMEVGTSQKVKIVAMPTNEVNGDYEYSSSDSSILTAAIGTIIANKVGVATIDDFFKEEIQEEQIEPEFDEGEEI